MKHISIVGSAFVLALAITGCAATPPAPQWGGSPRVEKTPEEKAMAAAARLEESVAFHKAWGKRIKKSLSGDDMVITKREARPSFPAETLPTLKFKVVGRSTDREVPRVVVQTERGKMFTCNVRLTETYPYTQVSGCEFGKDGLVSEACVDTSICFPFLECSCEK